MLIFNELSYSVIRFFKKQNAYVYIYVYHAVSYRYDLRVAYLLHLPPGIVFLQCLLFATSGVVGQLPGREYQTAPGYTDLVRALLLQVALDNESKLHFNFKNPLKTF